MIVYTMPQPSSAAHTDALPTEHSCVSIHRRGSVNGQCVCACVRVLQASDDGKQWVTLAVDTCTGPCNLNAVTVLNGQP